MNGVAAIAGIAVVTTGLQQSLGLLFLRQKVAAIAGIAVTNRVAAIAGIAVTSTTVAASTGVAVANTKVSAIGGFAVTNRKLQQSLGLLFLRVAAEAGYCRS